MSTVGRAVTSTLAGPARAIAGATGEGGSGVAVPRSIAAFHEPSACRAQIVANWPKTTGLSSRFSRESKGPVLKPRSPASETSELIGYQERTAGEGWRAFHSSFAVTGSGWNYCHS